MFDLGIEIPLNEKDLKIYWELVYKWPNPEWKKWDAPYYVSDNFLLLYKILNNKLFRRKPSVRNL